MNSKWVTLTVAIALAVFGFYVYQQNSNTSDDIVTLLGEDSSNLAAISLIAKDYTNEENVSINSIALPFEEAFVKSNQDFAAKTGFYDIVLQYNFALNPFVSQGHVHKIGELKEMPELQNLDYSFENDLFHNAWQEVGYFRSKKTVSPEQIAYPFATNTLLLVINNQLFNDKGLQDKFITDFGEPLSVPKSWPNFYKLAKFFSEARPEIYGVSLQGATGGWLYYEWAAMVAGFGGKIMDKDRGWDSDLSTAISLTSPAVIEATKFYLSLKPYNYGSFVNVDQNEQIRLIKSGNVAMGMIWSDYIYGFFSDENGEFDDRFSFVELPGTVSPLAGGAFYINSDSKNPVEALKFVNYLMQPNVQIKLARSGLCSPSKSVYDDVLVKRLPYANALYNSLERGIYAFEAGPDSDLISNAVTEAVQIIWSNSALDLETILKNAEGDIRKGRESL